MGWLERMGTAIRSQLQDWGGSSDDPEERLDQIIADMQMELIQLRQSVAQAIATQKRTERQQSRHQTWVVEWYDRANLALVQGDEADARAALSQRQSYLILVAKADQFLKQQQQVVIQLKGNLRTLEQHIVEARSRRDLYKARNRTAEASYRLQTLVAEMSARNTGIYEAIEERIMDLEVQASALADLNGTNPAVTPQQAADIQASIEAELNAMQGHSEQQRFSH